MNRHCARIEWLQMRESKADSSKEQAGQPCIQGNEATCDCGESGERAEMKNNFLNRRKAKEKTAGRICSP